MAGRHHATHPQRGNADERRQVPASAWLGAGAFTLDVAAALAGGSGIAHADTPHTGGATPHTNGSGGSKVGVTGPATSGSPGSRPRGFTGTPAPSLVGIFAPTGTPKHAAATDPVSPRITDAAASDPPTFVRITTPVTPLRIAALGGSAPGKTTPQLIPPALLTAPTVTAPLVAAAVTVTPPPPVTVSPFEGVANFVANVVLGLGGMNPANPQPNPANLLQVFPFSAAREIENTFDPAPPAGTPTVGAADPNTGVVTGSAVFAADPSGDVTFTAPATSTGGGAVTVNAATGAFTYTPTVAQRQAATPTTTDTFTANDGLSTSGEIVTVPVSSSTVTIKVGKLPWALAVSPDGKYVYVANELDSTVSVINTATNTVTTGVGSAPEGVAAGGSTVYVTSSENNTVSESADSGTTFTAVNVGVGPIGVAVSADGSHVYVADNGGNTLSVSTDGGKTFSSFPVGAGPIGVAVSADGTHVFVTNNGTNTVSVSTDGGVTFTAVTVGNHPGAIAVNAEGSHVYVAAGGTVWICTDGGTTFTSSTITGAQALALSADGTRLYVAGGGAVSVINTATNQVTATIPVGNDPFAVAVSPDGTHLYVANQGDNTVSVITLA